MSFSQTPQSENSKTIENSKAAEITVFAKTNFRNNLTAFGIKRADHRAHLYILGKTGTGKSTLLESLMLSDLGKGFGFALLDPHGDLVKRVKARITWSRRDDVIDFDAADPLQPYGFNPLAHIPADKRPLACSGLIQVFKHLWNDSWGPRLEHILRNSLLSLLDYPDANLADILKLLSDREFRKKVIPYISNKQIKELWIKEFDKFPERLRAEAISSIQNKVGAEIMPFPKISFREALKKCFCKTCTKTRTFLFGKLPHK